MLSGNEFLNTECFFVLVIVLALAVAIDIKQHRIPNAVLAPAFFVALILQSMNGGVGGLMFAISGLLFGIAMLLPLYSVGGMGAGDVKLLGIVGSFIGPWGAVVAGVATMMAGAVFGIIFIVWRRIQPILQVYIAQITVPADLGQSEFPAHSQPSSRDFSATGIPYAPAIAAGTAAALWYLGMLPLRITS